MGTSGPPSPVVQSILLGAVLAFVGGDALILGLWLRGRRTGQRLLAARWSLADLFLALQAVVGILLFVVTDLAVVLGMTLGPAARERLDTPGRFQLYALLLPMMGAQEVALVLVPAAIVWVRYRGSIRELGIPFSWGPDQWRRMAKGALLALPLLPLTDLLGTAIDRWVLRPGRFPFADELRQLSHDADALHLLDPLRHDVLALVFLGLLVSLIGPVAEEVFFRGFGFRVFRERFGRGWGFLLSALLFAAIHLNPAGLVPIFAIGLLLAWVYDRTGDLAGSIGLHCANNAIAFALYLVAPQFSFWERFFPR